MTAMTPSRWGYGDFGSMYVGVEGHDGCVLRCTISRPAVDTSVMSTTFHPFDRIKIFSLFSHHHLTQRRQNWPVINCRADRQRSPNLFLRMESQNLLAQEPIADIIMTLLAGPKHDDIWRDRSVHDLLIIPI